MLYTILIHNGDLLHGCVRRSVLIFKPHCNTFEHVIKTKILPNFYISTNAKYSSSLIVMECILRIIIIVIYSYYCAYISLRFKHAVLDTHLRYLGCLSRTGELVGFVSCYMLEPRGYPYIWSFKMRSGLKSVPR